jgi:hypothetical protein
VTSAGAAWPSGTRAFAVLTWGLAFHSAIMVVLLARGASVDEVRIAAAWKELLAVALVFGAALRIAMGRVPGLAVRAPDLFAAAIIVLAVVHAGAAAFGLGPDSEPADIALGVRDLVFGFALYAVGRTTPGVAHDPRALRRFVAVGVVTSAIAVVEWLVVTPEQLVLLGVASYFNEFLGVTALTRENLFGLPGNYWTMVGGRLVQRAGSVYLSSQGFAIPFLLVLPAAAVWITRTRRWRSPPAIAAYALLWVGLLLSLTRATTAACLVQLVALLVLWRRPGPFVALAGVGLVVGAALLVAVPGLPGFVWETVLWESASSSSHSEDYYKGLASLVERPLGAGLGTADATAARLGRMPITSDNLFLKFGVELGVAALVAFAAWMASVAWTAMRGAGGRPDRPAQAFCAFVAVATIGVAMNGMTAVLTNAPPIVYLFFWSAGAAVAVAPTAGVRAGDAG